MLEKWPVSEPPRSTELACNKVVIGSTSAEEAMEILYIGFDLSADEMKAAAQRNVQDILSDNLSDNVVQSCLLAIIIMIIMI
ncbi:hypothetical protein W03_05430 [Nitrosomonas sp. PY1]|nr:hypothetical protein W03_05430 [Nitrosomonas sp. PY1]